MYVAAGGPKFAVGKAGHPEENADFKLTMEEPALRITGDATMAQLIRRISFGLDAGMVDKTGLPGVYAIDLAWDSRAHGSNFLSAEALAAALESEEGAVEMIVVTGAERVPSEQ